MQAGSSSSSNGGGHSGDGARAADAAVVAACYATMAALFSVTSDEDFVAIGYVHRRGASLDAVDTEIGRLTALFVKRQPSEGAKAFGAALADTAHLKRLIEQMARPRSLWPSKMALFHAWAARANAEHPSSRDDEDIWKGITGGGVVGTVALIALL